MKKSVILTFLRNNQRYSTNLRCTLSYPCLVIPGKIDRIVPHKQSIRLDEVLPYAQAVTIPPWGINLKKNVHRL